MNQEPLPFGDPTQINQENAQVVKKGVLVGCGGCFMLFMLAVGGLAMILFVAEVMMRGSDISQETLRRARASAELRQELGEPIDMGWTVSGSINLSGNSGRGSFNIPISGPKAGMRILTRGEKVDGQWRYLEMRGTLPGGKLVDLLKPEEK